MFIKLFTGISILILGIGCASIQTQSSSSDASLHSLESNGISSLFEQENDLPNQYGWDDSNCAHIMADGNCAHPTGINIQNP